MAKSKSVSARVSVLAHENLMVEVSKDERNTVGYVLNRLLEGLSAESAEVKNSTVKGAFVKDTSTKKRKCQWPACFDFTDERESAALSFWHSKQRPDLNVREEWAKFETYCISNGKTYVDWNAAWRTFYTNAVKFNKAPTGGQSHGNVKRTGAERLAEQAKQLFGASDKPETDSSVVASYGRGVSPAMGKQVR